MENGRVTLIYIYALCSGRSELKAEEKKSTVDCVACWAHSAAVR